MCIRDSNLGALKAELGAQARGAFQALAGLKMAKTGAASSEFKPNQPVVQVQPAQVAIKSIVNQSPAKTNPAGVKHTAWTFGELPELLEIQKGGQTLICLLYTSRCV